ncbi:MAG: hypothetical protein JWO42_1520 [Chloroflexi bacterium]|nr:hypothetical protein [Chloroflexota bacterium]
MDTIHQPVTFEEARKAAENAARSHVSNFRKDESIPFLAERHLEAEHCWMFFRNEAIVVPPGRLLDWAYCVSKRGSLRSIADFSDDPVRLQEYLLTMSNYFRDRGE